MSLLKITVWVVKIVKSIRQILRKIKLSFYDNIHMCIYMFFSVIIKIYRGILNKSICDFIKMFYKLFFLFFFYNSYCFVRAIIQRSFNHKWRLTRESWIIFDLLKGIINLWSCLLHAQYECALQLMTNLEATRDIISFF